MKNGPLQPHHAPTSRAGSGTGRRSGRAALRGAGFSGALGVGYRLIDVPADFGIKRLHIQRLPALFGQTRLPAQAILQRLQPGKFFFQGGERFHLLVHKILENHVQTP